MVDSLLAVVRESPVMLSAVVALIFGFIIKMLLTGTKRLKLPVLDLSAYKDIKTALMEASLKVSFSVRIFASPTLQRLIDKHRFRQYPDTPYILPVSPDIIILPVSLMDEVKNLPDNKASFLKEVQRMFHHKHTGIGSTGPAFQRVIRGDLTRNVVSVIDDLQDEIPYAFNKELGSADAVSLPCIISNSELWYPHSLDSFLI